MTIDQLVVQLQFYLSSSLVVFESAQTLAYVTAVFPNRVHAAPDARRGLLERHYGTACAGCAREIALVPVVSLLGHESGGVK